MYIVHSDGFYKMVMGDCEKKLFQYFRQLGAAVDVQLLKHGAQMSAHRAFRYEKLLRDLSVAQTLGRQQRDFTLPRGQVLGQFAHGYGLMQRFPADFKLRLYGAEGPHALRMPRFDQVFNKS